MSYVYSPFLYDEKPDKEEVLEMNEEQKNAAIRGLINVAKSNRGEQTDSERARAHHVAFLAGKQQQPKQLRPGVSQLLGRDD